MSWCRPVARTLDASAVPKSQANVTARFLREGEFMHPAEGITLYIREIAATGELMDVLLSDARDPGRRVTYSALKALAIRADTGPKLLMFDGMAQTYSTEDRRLTITRFVDFTYDVGGFISGAARAGRSLEELSTLELLWADPAAWQKPGPIGR